MSTTTLGALRVRLTAWYLVTLSAIIVILGAGLYFEIGHQFDRELVHSLREATSQLERAARTREAESGASGSVVDAVVELRIPDRALYLLTPAGVPDTPAAADEWIRSAAAAAGVAGSADRQRWVAHEVHLQLHAERFQLTGGATLVAVAVADKVDLDDRYAELIAAFGASAFGAIVLVALGAWLLVRQSTLPIEETMAQMRRFMADAAHELRTPLTVLRTRAEVALQRPRGDGDYIDSLRVIEGESRRLGRIVDDLLILARADAGERDITRERIFLDDIVADAVGAAGVLAAPRGVTVTMVAFEEAAIRGDGELIRQLVVILLDNAIKFTPAGGAVSVRVGTDDGTPFVEVRDNGIGISADQLPHIFERFYRGDVARARSAAGAGGSGLGLAIAQWVATAHGGSIVVSSSTDTGTTAMARFPAAPVDAMSSS